MCSCFFVVVARESSQVAVLGTYRKTIMGTQVSFSASCGEKLILAFLILSVSPSLPKAAAVEPAEGPYDTGNVGKFLRGVVVRVCTSKHIQWTGCKCSRASCR